MAFQIIINLFSGVWVLDSVGNSIEKKKVKYKKYTGYQMLYSS